jgi:hypothetical protein
MSICSWRTISTAPTSELWSMRCCRGRVTPTTRCLRISRARSIRVSLARAWHSRLRFHRLSCFLVFVLAWKRLSSFGQLPLLGDAGGRVFR